jgi:hypothetical protein
MIFGEIDDKGNAVVRWNTNTDRLEAPGVPIGSGAMSVLKWHPCDQCGIVEAVTPGIQHFTCDACVGDLEWLKPDLSYLGRCIERDYTVPKDLHDKQMVGGFLPRVMTERWIKLALRARRKETNE